MRWLLPVILLISLASLPVHSLAAAPAAEQNVSIELKEVPFRQAVERLFRGTGMAYTIEPDFPDVPITLRLQDVPFAVALRSLTRLADGTFRRQNGKWVIGRRQENPKPVGRKVTLKLKNTPFNNSLKARASNLPSCQR
jgi:hypothetical protein